MEALILYLMMLLGTVVGGPSENPATDQGTTTTQQGKNKKQSSDGTISTFDGGSSTWDDNGVAKPPVNSTDPNGGR